MAKTFHELTQNGTISIHYFVKWQFSLWVTFQAYETSSFCWQHHTLKSTTFWMFSLVVIFLRCFSWEWSCFLNGYYIELWCNTRSSSSISIFYIHLLLMSIKYGKIDQNWWYRQQIVTHVVLFLKRVTTGHPRLMLVCTDQFPISNFCRPCPLRQICLIASSRVNIKISDKEPWYNKTSLRWTNFSSPFIGPSLHRHSTVG